MDISSTLLGKPQQGTHLIYLKNSLSLLMFEIENQVLAGYMGFASIIGFFVATN